MDAMQAEGAMRTAGIGHETNRVRMTFQARRIGAAALAAALWAAGANAAEVKLPTRNVPVPTFKPLGYAAGSATRAQDALSSLLDHEAADVAVLKSGLGALSKGDIAGAMRIRDTIDGDALDHHILSWAIALEGGDVTSAEIARVEDELAGWPGMAAIRRNLELALDREEADPAAVVEQLAGATPLTHEGTMLLARALAARGDDAGARAVIAPYWQTARLEAREEASIRKEFDAFLERDDHRVRMEQMLHHDRVSSALRIAAAAGAEPLARAWGAVIRRERNAGKLLDQVPSELRGTGYHFAKARHLRWSKRYADAAEIILATPAGERIVDPDAWWVERRVLSRELLDIGDAQQAYLVAAAHAAEQPAMQADAEFHAGWYALRELGDADRAAAHFERITEIAEGPISLARAHYWLGRAAEAGGPGEAVAHFRRAAAHGTAFYGQLAAARLGETGISAAVPSPSDEDRRAFNARQAVQAIRRLEAAGQQPLANLLYRDLAGEIESTGELALLAQMAETRGDHHLALRIGKIAQARGLDIGGLSHPLGAIPRTAALPDAGKALAYAIARQESEFNVGAVSPAGARGLLQLLPPTARAMARRAGVAYSPQRLVTDAGYNATLGSAYLGDQLERFAGSYVLTFAGYNAGPGRARDWMERYGDPRGMEIDEIVDWIERIPFTETRNYVQRVMENYQVYKMRLTGRSDIAVDLVNGR